MYIPKHVFIFLVGVHGTIISATSYFSIAFRTALQIMTEEICLFFLYTSSKKDSELFVSL